jgi:ferredoxin
MAYVIAEPCIGVKDKGCVTVCPCDCIHEGTVETETRTFDMLFIDPDVCIDCGLCETECPVGAIFLDVDLPRRWEHFTQLNATYFHRSSQP